MKILKKIIIIVVAISILFSLNKNVLAYDSVQNKAYSITQIEEIIKKQIYNRSDLITIMYIGDTSDLKNKITSIINNIESKDDYLKFSILSWKWDAKGYENQVQITFRFNYLTSSEEESYVSAKIDEILSKLIYKNMSLKEKERKIHDFIVSNIAYDTNLKEHSAYSGLKYGYTVCQGYALLAYKMLNQVGIETKIIEGYAGGQPHAWNLVNLNGSWHHLDCTWDDPVPDVHGRVITKYFNIKDDEMSKTHTWDKDKYPKATNEYMKNYNSELKEMLNAKIWKMKYPNYKEIKSIIDVPTDKKFMVSFNKDVDWKSVTSDTMKLINVENKDEMPVNFEFISAKKINLIPKFNLERGKAYYLVINDKISGVDSEKIKEGIICPIKVKD